MVERTRKRNGQGGGMASVAKQAAKAEEILTGSKDDVSKKQDEVRAAVAAVANRVNSGMQRIGAGAPLETMGRLQADSLLNQKASAPTGPKENDKTVRQLLDEVEVSLISDIFFDERARLKDYQTFQQIYGMITQVGEAVQVYTDNIISPDDWTKRDVEVAYEGVAEGTELAEVQRRYGELRDLYDLDDVIEEAITKSLYCGDFFTMVLNLRQEVEGLLTESGDGEVEAHRERVMGDQRLHISEHHVPQSHDPDMRALVESAAEYARECNLPQPTAQTARHELAEYFDSLIVVNETTNSLSAKTSAVAASFGGDSAAPRDRLQAGYAAQTSTDGRGRRDKEADKPSLKKANIRGSVLKMIEPDSVIKLYHEDMLFGYYYVEYASDPEFGRRNSQDSTLVRTIDTQISSKIYGNTRVENPRDKLISRIFVKSLAERLGKSKFLVDNEQFTRDAYAILKRAKAEQKRAVITYVSPDQMIHWTPNGTRGYGESILSRVKFLAKLYIGTLANAFMRNSIRQTEMLAYYIDVGLDNDAQNAIQNFMRTVKQREVRFNGLKDVTTVLNQVGNFHDLFIPTINGERPVEIETINMGQPAQVDNEFLDYLRKAIIAGMGVPAAFIGYSEEVSFARTMSMDNGRFLRRVLRHQKHFGKAATKLFRALWLNEYRDLEAIGRASAKPDAESKKVDIPIDPSRIVARFPSPATLNMTNLTEKVGQVQQIADYVATTMVKPDEDAEVKQAFTYQIVKDLIPSASWDKWDKFLSDARKSAGRDKAIEAPEAPAAAPDTAGAGADVGGDFADEEL